MSLPPLFVPLHRGAPVGAPDSKEPRVEPGGPLLTSLPRDVIELMVTQAALGARKSASPTIDMCAWMQSFCRSAQVQGLPCDDNWFRLALSAFGHVPEPSALPERSGFKSWRALFYGLCKAFNHPDVDLLARVDPLFATFWERAAPALMPFTDFWNMPGPHMLHLNRFLNPDASQRELDTLLHGLIAGQIQASAISYHYEAARMRFKAVWKAWFDGQNVPLRRDTRPWMAVVTLLLMRGAVPFNYRHYQDLDKELYDTMARSLMTGQAAAFRAVKERVRELLANGASPDCTVSSIDFPVTFVGNRPGRLAPTLLAVALYYRNAEAVRLLLDAGASPNNRTLRQVLSVGGFSDWGFEALNRATMEQLITMHHGLAHHNGPNEPWLRYGMRQAIARPGQPDWLRDAWQALRDAGPWNQTRTLYGFGG